MHVYTERLFHVIMRCVHTTVYAAVVATNVNKRGESPGQEPYFFLSQEEMSYAPRSSIFNSIELPMCGT